MATKKTSTVKKTAAKKAVKKTPVARTTYDTAARIKVVKEHETREGSSVDQVWNMVAKSKTVGDYLKRRKAAGLEGMGGLFGQFVKDGFIRVGK